MIKQIAVQKFLSDCGKACIHVENDMPVGLFHDFLLKIKGQMIDLMVKNHKEEQAQAEEQKKIDECCSSSDDEPA